MSKEAVMLQLELHYLPLIQTFHLIKESDKIILITDEHYQKQTFRNRTIILTSNGPLTLTIPVKHDAKKIREVKIDYDQPWVNNHLKAIISSYKHAPYFEFYFPYFEEIYKSRIPFLYTFNLELFFLCNKILKLHQEIILQQSLSNLNPAHSHGIYK